MASSYSDQHLHYFINLFDHIEQNNHIIQPGKCVFGATEITFLIHVENT